MDNSFIKKELLRLYNPEERAIWIIFGEDPNCDLGGSHHNPKLATVTGTYKNVVDYALKLKGFFTWGGGGIIERADPPFNLLDVDKLYDPEIKKLEAEKESLKNRLESIDKEISSKIKGNL